VVLPQAVIEAVTSAFGDVALPPSDAMVENHCIECVETWQSLCDPPRTFLSWQVVGGQDARPIEDVLLSLAAWRYYLPALIIWCVRDPRRADVLVDNLAHRLSRRSEADWAARSAGFTPEQRAAIVFYLEW
jgi:hypothetical protein